ncbi:hypothetical protein ACFL1H_07745 [Nanoarchaeota archaeon]
MESQGRDYRKILNNLDVGYTLTFAGLGTYLIANGYEFEGIAGLAGALCYGFESTYNYIKGVGFGFGYLAGTAASMFVGEGLILNIHNTNKIMGDASLNLDFGVYGAFAAAGFSYSMYRYLKTLGERTDLEFSECMHGVTRERRLEMIEFHRRRDEERGY